MSGCELSHCNYYVNGKCTSEADFVDCETGEDMCYRNSRAIPREEYDKQHTKERPDA